MNEQEVVVLMESSKTKDEWKNNADKVKRTCGGYPAFWYQTIILSGLAARVRAKFGEQSDITCQHW